MIKVKYQLQKIKKQNLTFIKIKFNFLNMTQPKIITFNVINIKKTNENEKITICSYQYY